MAPRTLSLHPKPDVSGGIEYWQTVEANVNGVLGGYGLGTLPRVDALGSRLFLLSLLPRLSTIPDVTQDPKAWREQRAKRGGGRRTRALDAGAGVGRVTKDVLGLILDEVHLVEPVRKFLVQAATEAPTWPSLQPAASSSTSSQAQPKSVHFHISTLHAIDPARPWSTSDGGIFLNPNGSATATNGGGRNKRAKVDSKEKKLAGQAGESDAGLIPPVTAPLPEAKPTSKPSTSAEDAKVDIESEKATATASAAPGDAEAEPLQYDVIWCQWMLQHLSDPDLISFLHRAKAALVKDVRPAAAQQGGDEDVEENGEGKEDEPQDGVIVVKENVCTELEDGSENVWWDEEDKSITRSSKAYERVFREAGLEVVRCEVQEGLPAELFVVKMWALR